MHTPETQQKFIELRSREWTYDRIAAELGVAKSTLIEWSRKFRFDINNRLALEVDELRHRILGPRQDVGQQLEPAQAEPAPLIPLARFLEDMRRTRRNLAEGDTSDVHPLVPVR